MRVFISKGGESLIMSEFEEIYQKYYPQTYKYLMSLCRNSQIAEELCQDTFCQALQSIERYDGSCKLGVWLCQIAKHLWYKELRRHDKHPSVEVTEDITHETLSLEEHSIQKEEKLRIFSFLHSLPEAMREVVYLRLSGELSFREIGQILGKTENWARVTYYRAKQKIRSELL